MTNRTSKKPLAQDNQAVRMYSFSRITLYPFTCVSYVHVLESQNFGKTLMRAERLKLSHECSLIRIALASSFFHMSSCISRVVSSL